MREIFSPFRTKQGLKKIFICALIFIGMAVPFKVMVLIEGFTEVRPVNAVPVVMGLLLGPAGAWGCAIGNLVSDLFGTLTYGSLLGFIGNFIAAYLPYKLWHISGKMEKPNVKNTINLARYILIIVVAAIATAILIACGLDVLFGNWMPRFFWIIIMNDIGFPLFLGLPVLIVLTTEESKMEATLPLNNTMTKTTKKLVLVKYTLLFILLASEAALLFMIALDMQMSASLLMAVTGVIFIIALFKVVCLKC